MKTERIGLPHRSSWAAQAMARATSSSPCREWLNENRDDRIDARIARDLLDGCAVLLGGRGSQHIDRDWPRSLRPAGTQRSRAFVSSASVATSSPSASQASAHRIAGPPTLVTMPTRRPVGSGCVASSAAMSNRPSIVSARMTPAWRKRASTVTSEAATSAPVCDDVARAPAAERPLLIATIGLVASDATGDPAELARVAERLKVEQDDVGLRVRLPVVEQVVAGDVGLVPHRDEVGDAEPTGSGLAGSPPARAPRSGRRRRPGRAAACSGRTWR